MILSVRLGVRPGSSQETCAIKLNVMRGNRQDPNLVPFGLVSDHSLLSKCLQIFDLNVPRGREGLKVTKRHENMAYICRSAMILTCNEIFHSMILVVLC